MSLNITDDLIARQAPDAQAIIRALLARIAELEARLNKTPKNSSLPPSTEHPHAKPPRDKRKKENLIKASSIPYTIVRATQFFEFVGAMAQSATDGQSIRLPPALMQPVASDDVAAVLAVVALETPSNRTIEVAGPEPIRMDGLVRRFLNANRDARQVTTDVHALYFGTEVNDQSLTPGNHPRIGPTRFEDWLDSRSMAAAR